MYMFCKKLDRIYIIVLGRMQSNCRVLPIDMCKSVLEYRPNKSEKVCIHTDISSNGNSPNVRAYVNKAYPSILLYRLCMCACDFTSNCGWGVYSSPLA